MSNNLPIYIHDFLIEKKEISLEKIGQLHLKQSTITTEDGHTFPEVDFVYDKVATTTPEFITFTTEREGKNSAIVESDIAYFLDENRQLMNIGTSVLMIPGIGYIHSLKTGGYSFSQKPISGFREAEVKEKAISGDIYDRTLDSNNNENTEESRSLRPRRSSGGSGSQVNYLGIGLVVVLVAALGFGLYYFFSHKSNGTAADQGTVNTTDTIGTQTSETAATPQPSTDAAKPAATNANDGDFYKFVFEITKDASRARSRIAKLKTYGDKVAYDSVQTTEGLYYRLYSPVPKSADTTKAKDSLFKYFQKPIRIAKFN